MTILNEWRRRDYRKNVPHWSPPERRRSYWKTVIRRTDYCGNWGLQTHKGAKPTRERKYECRGAEFQKL